MDNFYQHRLKNPLTVTQHRPEGVYYFSMTIVGVDVGKVRVGVATADPEVKIAFPLGVWLRAQNEAESNLLKLLGERNASILVVGMPLDPDGNRTPICESIEGFVRRIAKRIPIKIEYVDEAFSSVEATERLSQVGSVERHIDAHAACLILDRYFELRSEPGGK